VYTAPNGTHFKAKCVWMQGTDVLSSGVDKRESIKLKQMKIDVTAYGHDVGPDQIVNNTDLYCSSTIFSNQDQNPIASVPLQSSTANGSSDVGISGPLKGAGKPSPRSKRSAERLVISSSDQDSAVGLCQSATSRGSDLVSTAEGLFCDMDSKTLYPLCSKTIGAECFDLNLYQIRSRRRDMATERTYQGVERWD
jgi:hypothetical protein